MTKKIYPGMLDTRIEYFQEDGDVYKIENGAVTSFDNTDHPELAMIIDTEAGLQTILSQMCGNEPRIMQKKLAQCRFGALNFEADFCEKGSVTHEYVECAHRGGNCIGENIVCKTLELNGAALSQQQLEILRGCAGNEKNETLAGIFNMPFGSFNVLKNETYKAARIHTKQETAILLMQKGLL